MQFKRSTWFLRITLLALLSVVTQQGAEAMVSPRSSRNKKLEYAPSSPRSPKKACLKDLREEYDLHIEDLGNNIQLTILNEDIPYSYGYDTDDVNFTASPTEYVGKVKTGKTFILLNFHGDTPLHTFRTFEAVRDAGKRTFKWGSPCDYATDISKGMKTLGDVLNQLALLLPWSDEKVRKTVSIILIPGGTPLRFKIGQAALQYRMGEYMVYNESAQTCPVFKEIRVGGGVQIRLETLPKGTVILSAPVLQFQDHDRRTKRYSYTKEEKSFDLKPVLTTILSAYQTKYPKSSMSGEAGLKLIEFINNFGAGAEGVLVDVPEEIGDYYMDPPSQ